MSLVVLGLWPLGPAARFAPVGLAAPSPVAPPPLLADAVVAEAAASVLPSPEPGASPAASVPVVGIGVTSCGARGTGTGVVVADGLVLTAAHVVGDAGLVALHVGAVTVTGEVLGTAPGADLALVAAPVSGSVRLAPRPRPGEVVRVVGAAGAERSGTVVAVDPSLAPGVGEPIGIAVALEPGWSGAAVVTADGGVAALVSAGVRPGALTLAESIGAVVVAAESDPPGAGLVAGSCPTAS
ncbi:MAG: serine protease [Actinomyces sp.]|nr:MAG: serine protease [Actinomyces sp.]